MNKILKEIKKLITESQQKYLPDIKNSDLEENGTIYYMNGQNGTEFDWYVNDRISDFMTFYNDKQNLGAIKLAIYKDGSVYIYIYGDKGKKLIKTAKANIQATEKELLNLALILKAEADNKSLFDVSIDKLNTNLKITPHQIADFKSNQKYYENLRDSKKIFSKQAYVSKKITKEGWKVGYMVRNESLDEQDSGWQFLAGNEDEGYLESPENIELLNIASVCEFDSAILKYLYNPVSTQLIRISSSEFVIDDNKIEIYMEKRR